ncbi:MAG: DUF4082 domain-containing protein [Verrucomicrobiales bacterium]|nr:DUF4082 domain-containing protein [Verrucomicrobiales bacterium]
MKANHSALLIVLAASSSILSVHAQPQLVTGFVKREVFLIFLNVAGATVADLTGSAKFTGNQPDAVSLLNSFEAPRRGGGEYGQRVSGWLVPPTTGAYVFFVASDNDSELWLSTNQDPANKQLIAGVTGNTASRQWNKYPDTQNNAAAPVALQAGQAYYVEALVKEDTDEDNLAVGWVLPGQTVDPFADPPVGLENVAVIPGSSLGAMVNPANSTVTITMQPAAVKSSPGSSALFWVKAEGTSDLGPHLLYQWKRNGADIAGANASAYLTPELALSDDGTRYSCVVSVPGKAATSPEATLTVANTQAAGLRIAALPSPAAKVAVSWEDTDFGFDLLGASALGSATAWIPVTEQPSYEGTTARVELEAGGNRFFRLKHEMVVPESLWSADAKPDTDVTGSPGQELGTIFNAKVPGLIRAIRLYSFPGESGVRLARIWRNSDNSVVGGPYEIPSLVGEGWVAFDLPKALAIEAEVDYTVSVSTAQDPGKVYPRSVSVVPAPGSNDRSLRYPAAAGVFSTQLGARPSQTDRNSYYFRDVVFLPGEVPSENVITWALDQPVSLGRGGDEADREFGTIFRSSVAGTITAIRVFGLAAESGAHQATIWRNSDGSVLGGPYELRYGCNGQVCGSVWVLQPLETPLSIEPNTDYTVSVSTGEDFSKAYPFVGQAFGTAGGNGQHLSFPARAGVSGAPGSRPTQTDAANPNYLRDIVFQPTGSSVSENLMGGGAVYAGGLSTPHELGTVFQSSIAGTIKAIRVYSASAEAGAHTARIWRNSDNSLVGGPYPLNYGGTIGWMEFALPAAIAVEPNVHYTISVSTGEDAAKTYPFVPDGFASAGGNTKHLSYPANAGVLSQNLGTRPTQAPNANSYLRDVVFQPAAENARATIGNTTDGTFRDYITDGATTPPTPYINANQFKASADMTITTIKAKIENAPGEYKCAVYTDKSGLGDRLLASTEPKSNPPNGWNDFPLTTPLKLKAGELYWLAIWSNDKDARVYYSSQTGGRLRWKAYQYGDWPDPIEMDPNGSEYLYCLYAEGTFDAPKPRATIGNTTDGTFRDYITDANDAYINANQFKASGNMTVTTIKAKVENAPGEYKCAVYTDANGLADRLLAITHGKTNPPNGWNEFPLATPLKLKAGDLYWLAIWSNDKDARVYYSSQTGGRLRWKAYPYGNWPDPIEMDPNGSEYLYCLYAEGTFDD